MPKVPALIAAYIAAQPEELQPALHEINALLATAFPQAQVEMYSTAKGEIPIYKERDSEAWLGGFSARSKGAMVYMIDPALVAKHKPQLGSLAAPGNGACVLYKPTKALEAAALRELIAQMFAEAAARRKLPG